MNPDLCHGFRDSIFHQMNTGQHRNERIPELLTQSALQTRHASQSIGDTQDHLRDRFALFVVTVQQRIRRFLMNNQREFPCEVHGILDTGVHSLAARRAMDMRRIACEKNAADAKIRDFPMSNVKARHPDRICQTYPGFGSALYDRLDFVKLEIAGFLLF